MTPLYRITGLTKEYNGRRVLDLPALEIQSGELLALVGPSGAGKSTLLRLLNFLELPSRGDISFKDSTYNSGKQPPLDVRRTITTVFQRPALLKRSVFDNIAYGLRLRRHHAIREAITDILGRVGLNDLAPHPARTLSGGEAQRVALARALCLQPEVLLLDEPTANLDPYNINLIEDIIQRHRAETNATVVLVTHNTFQARRLADRVGLMLNGSLVELTGRDEFFESPRDARTRAFIAGEMIY
ncbi:MAG: ATP-binding cassette domain-containing protein [Anaerolineae bacterium]|nr:MAG: ATP-binding cassette domain-containing protein [Anaerolineae bacterium]